MAACDLDRDRKAVRRRGARGMTLTLTAVLSSVLLLALGTVYLTSGTSAYELSALRMREAELVAAVDAGLAEALVKLTSDRSAPVDITLALGHATVRATSGAPATTTTLTIEATSGRDDPRGRSTSSLRRRLIADVDVTVAGKPRVVAVRRE